MAVTRLSGGTTPANGSDPRTFPTIWNATADVIEANETAIDSLALTSLSGVSITSPVDNQLLTYNGTNWVNEAPAVPAGSVLQVVSTTLTSGYTESIASGAVSSAVVPGLTASITPTATSNKIFVSVVVHASGEDTPSSVFSLLYRDSTAIAITNALGSRARMSAGARVSDNHATVGLSTQFLDEPSTTSPLVYGVRFAHSNSSTSLIKINRANSDVGSFSDARYVSTITLMEVAG